MWSFEGEYKKRPKQSLSGRSRTLDKQSFLNKLKLERNVREENRKKEYAAIKIQAWVRGVLIRSKILNEQRKEMDNLMQYTSDSGLDRENAEKLVFLIIKIFNVKEDCNRLLTLCQLIISQQKELGVWIQCSFSKWRYLFPRLTNLALRALSFEISTIDRKPARHTIPLRLLEILSSLKFLNKDEVQKKEFQLSFFSYLISHGYYQHLMKIFLERVPEVIEHTYCPPTPFSDSLMSLFIQPIQVLFPFTDNSLNKMYFSEICKGILKRGNDCRVHNFVLPTLAVSPFVTNEFIESLIEYYYDSLNEICSYQLNPSLLLSLLILVNSEREFSNLEIFSKFIYVVGGLLEGFPHHLKRKVMKSIESDCDSTGEDEEEEMEISEGARSINDIICDKCLDILNSSQFVSWIIFYVERCINNDQILISFSKIFHHVLSLLKFELHTCKMLYSVVLKRQILLKPLWNVLTTLGPVGQTNNIESDVNCRSYRIPLLQVLAHGYPLTPIERDILIPILSTFSASLIGVLATLHDSEFLRDAEITNEKSLINSFPFTIEEVVQMSSLLRDVCVGFVDYAHPDVRMSAYVDGTFKSLWTNCFKVCVSVVRQIHLRDTRRRFCPENHWQSSKCDLKMDKSPFNFRQKRRRKLFHPVRYHSKDELESEGPIYSVNEERRSTLLYEIPFVFPFTSRMQIFSDIVSNDRRENQDNSIYSPGSNIDISIRRTHIYEDAFDKLAYHNERNMRLKMRVSLTNVTGLNEVGVDGGGIFREFLTELLNAAFDPNRGFFLMTRDNMLYPNPGAKLVASDFRKHYYFIGRMVGKALYENHLVEIPLAGFFLTKLLCGSSSVDLNYLDSLDPELCKNLLSLKTDSGDISDLGLDFTVLSSYLGQNTVEELVPDGANIPVTNDNVIEYIYRMADYKLNREIAPQCQAFKEGVFDVIDAKWLRLFNCHELQMLISGAAAPIDIDDLKENTRYSGVYNVEHPTIKEFWKVVCNFDEAKRRQLLKFVTSCSRPPLLGFKELYPVFCIHPSGSEDRLPSASTCMNLLKLPMYKDYETLREKLVYAITSSAGFELS